MPSQSNSPIDSQTSVTFEGVLDRDRVKRLFAHRSLGDRALMFFVWLAMAALLFGVLHLAGGGGRMPNGVRWGLSVSFGIGMFAAGLVQQFSHWHCRRWFRWNSHLAGSYRTVVAENHIDLQTDRFALRVGYRQLPMVDHGRSCVRIGFDPMAARAILLPLEDATPAITVRELEQFIKQQMRESKRNPLELPEVRNAELPLPFSLPVEPSAIRFQGPQRQGELLAAVEANNPQAKHEAAKKPIYLLMAVCFVALLMLLVTGTLAGRQFDRGVWLQLISVGIFLLFVFMMGMMARRAKANIQADPDAEAGRADGWISATGLAVHYNFGYTALRWDACDAIEVTDDQILAKFWKGDFLLVARHMFASDAEFEQAKQWARRFNAPSQTA